MDLYFTLHVSTANYKSSKDRETKAQPAAGYDMQKYEMVMNGDAIEGIGIKAPSGKHIANITEQHLCLPESSNTSCKKLWYALHACLLMQLQVSVHLVSLLLPLPFWQSKGNLRGSARSLPNSPQNPRDTKLQEASCASTVSSGFHDPRTSISESWCTGTGSQIFRSRRHSLSVSACKDCRSSCTTC